MRPVRALAATALGAALLAGCVRPVDVAPSTTAEPAVTSTVAPSGATSGSSSPSRHRTDLPRTLRVAVSFDQPGIGLRQGDSYTGLDVDVAEHIARYLGIPYAKPPVGERRFALPEPADPFEGVFEATAFGPTPPPFTISVPEAS